MKGIIMQERTIKTWRDPYDAGFSTTTPKEITLHSGLTVLVGCNGAGKTTLLKNIESVLQKDNIPYHKYNNLNDGGNNSVSEMFYSKNYSEMAYLVSASEGEAIKENVGLMSQNIRSFLETGFYNSRKNRFAEIFRSDKEKEQTPISNERWLLFDATDSGMSIDAVIELKEFFHMILKDSENQGLDIYIIISANEYELASGTDCFDVQSGKYISFSDYSEYKDFILKTRIKKEKRIKKAQEICAKRREKEIVKMKKEIEKNTAKIKEIDQKTKEKNRDLTYGEKYRINDLKRMIERNQRELKNLEEKGYV